MRAIGGEAEEGCGSVGEDLGAGAEDPEEEVEGEGEEEGVGRSLGS